MKTTVSPGNLDVWFCFTGDKRLNTYLGAYNAMLSDSEREQYEQLPQQDQRHDYLVSRVLLRTVLAGYCDCEPNELVFGVSEYGKPELLSPAGQDLQFNTAHTHGLTVCVVGRSYPVGIDAEYHSDSASLLSVADDYFSSQELQALHEKDSEEAKLADFFRYWTLKEAYLKARGQGLSIPLHDFSVVLKDGAFVEFCGPEAERWDFRLLLQDANYTAALAMGAKIQQLRLLKCIPLGPVEEFNAT
ncbi:4'-phosphopantetheinyl transferase superfamily protein [Spongiibacter taiwanensis]|uniref:4'-phosphopantetheinyl transferase family protein n=1 Tax=Spongiibacter taiwanensis TaxID=1748242 RepID=UPI0020358A3B|nr:4'-phosphopantetheinyl transferase superfamily protein [Spongiibacter taiwanensis]USA43399.1 4'-phosphopantetheinyl transferase superfamily protein [Spongiibacter taiwanensis]